MKKTLKSKLTFKKDLISDLNDNEQLSIQGGGGPVADVGTPNPTTFLCLLTKPCLPTLFCSIGATQCASCTTTNTSVNVCA